MKAYFAEHLFSKPKKAGKLKVRTAEAAELGIKPGSKWPDVIVLGKVEHFKFYSEYDKNDDLMFVGYIGDGSKLVVYND
jgi:hypothetical protein